MQYVNWRNHMMGFTMRQMTVHLLLAMSVGCIVNVVDTVSAQEKKPNVLVIMGDDIGNWNVSAYHQGMMGYTRPISIASPNTGGRSRPV
jgi:hypothetical protein